VRSARSRFFTLHAPSLAQAKYDGIAIASSLRNAIAGSLSLR